MNIFFICSLFTYWTRNDSFCCRIITISILNQSLKRYTDKYNDHISNDNTVEDYCGYVLFL